jgi:subtilisin-like proprotein convertase family protein
MPRDDGNDCTIDQCEVGVPVNLRAPKGTPCAQGGGSVCDEAGTCVMCNVPVDCESGSNECQPMTCLDSVCVAEPTPDNTPLIAQTSGDCRLEVCDGLGGVKSIPLDADIPEDMPECAIKSCLSGDVISKPEDAYAPCTSGGKYCDGKGTCVECVVSADCGVSTECSKHTCEAGACSAGDPNLPAGSSCVGGVCDGEGACFPCSPTLSATVQSTDTPLDVPNNDATGTSSTVTISGLAGEIVDVNVTVDIDGDANTELDIRLQSPEGTVIELSSGNGGYTSGGFAGTTFDDDVTAPYVRITNTTFPGAGPVPFAIPERNLGRLNGEAANGPWKLTVKDVGIIGPFGGTLNNWSIAVKTQAGNAPLAPVTATHNVEEGFSNAAPLLSTLDVNGVPGVIYSASVTAAIVHGSSGQVSLSLISPSGKSTLLSSKNGGQSSNVWNGTTFSDNAALLVGCTGAGCVTYANNVVVPSAIPQGSLSALVGGDPNGTWTLHVTDDTNGINGTLTSWSLSLTPVLCPITP